MPTHYSGSGSDRRALDVYIKLMRASGSVHRDLEPIVQKYGLTQGQFGVLEALEHLGPLHQCTLSEKLFYTDGNITHLISSLEKRTLVRRVRDADDRRYVRVHLSARGRSLIRKAFPAYVAGLRERLGHLNERQLREFEDLCRLLGRPEKKS